MDFRWRFCTVILLLTLCQDVNSQKPTISFTPSPNEQAGITVKGGTMSFTCDYSAFSNIPFKSIITYELYKNDAYLLAISVINFNTSDFSIDYIDTIRDRVTDAEYNHEGRRFTLHFNRTICDDMTSYYCKVSYVTPSSVTAQSDALDVTVKAKPVFDNHDGGPIIVNPTMTIVEGDELTFTCEGNVGGQLPGQLVWYYYLNGAPPAIPINNSVQNFDPTPLPDDCSSTRRSILTLTMERRFNNFVVRCTVQQSIFDANGDGYKQTNALEVHYSPGVPVITKNPDQVSYTEGQDVVTMTCSSDANPPASYYWIQENSTEIVYGNVLVLDNLTLAHTGDYVCVTYNELKGVNHSANSTTSIQVIEPTTLAPTTTTSSTPAQTDTTDQPKTDEQNDPDKNDDPNLVAIIVPIAVVLFLVIIIVVAVILWRKKRAAQENHEEPPTKPARPDLVTSDPKHHSMGMGLNSSFNNSFDSTADIKQRTEDGLLYIDLQFDDKPRSRRPIQLIDNGNPAYADITMPRV